MTHTHHGFLARPRGRPAALHCRATSRQRLPDCVTSQLNWLRQSIAWCKERLAPGLHQTKRSQCRVKRGEAHRWVGRDGRGRAVGASGGLCAVGIVQGLCWAGRQAADLTELAIRDASCAVSLFSIFRSTSSSIWPRSGRPDRLVSRSSSVHRRNQCRAMQEKPHIWCGILPIARDEVGAAGITAVRTVDSV